MSRQDALDLLKPFLPGLEAALADPDVSEIMINGPGNVWLEGHGRLDASLPRPPWTRRRWNARRFISRVPSASTRRPRRSSMRAWATARAWRSASRPPARTSRSPCDASARDAFSAAQLVEQGALPEHIRHAAERTLHTRRNILVSGGTGSGKTTLLNALIALIPDDERIVAIEDTLGAAHRRPELSSGSRRAGSNTGPSPSATWCGTRLRHRPDHIVVGEVRGGEAADLLQALNTGHGGSLTTVHANNAESALSRLASCAMQGGGDLPWEVTCRGVVDGIAMVIHMTRADGRRFVEEAAYVRGYEAGSNAWEIERLDRTPR